MRFKDADARSAIWSLDVGVYEILISAVPFLADTRTEVLGRVLQEEHTPPNHVCHDLPAAVRVGGVVLFATAPASGVKQERADAEGGRRSANVVLPPGDVQVKEAW